MRSYDDDLDDWPDEIDAACLVTERRVGRGTADGPNDREEFEEFLDSRW